MSEYVATTKWQRMDDESFVDGKYSRAHSWRFDGGAEVAASASPQVVPPPYSVEAYVDPEEAFVASLSSCHLLWFLHFAMEKRWRVDYYRDEAVGTMAKDGEGKLAMTEVILRPAVRFGGDQPPDEQVAELHRRAHESCFIANSVTTKVSVQPAAATT